MMSPPIGKPWVKRHIGTSRGHGARSSTSVRNHAAACEARLAQIFDFFTKGGWRINVYAGELDVRPTSAPTIEWLAQRDGADAACSDAVLPSSANQTWEEICFGGIGATVKTESVDCGVTPAGLDSPHVEHPDSPKTFPNEGVAEGAGISRRGNMRDLATRRHASP